jgi:hypothetical protein
LVKDRFLAGQNLPGPPHFDASLAVAIRQDAQVVTADERFRAAVAGTPERVDRVRILARSPCGSAEMAQRPV